MKVKNAHLILVGHDGSLHRHEFLLSGDTPDLTRQVILQSGLMFEDWTTAIWISCESNGKLGTQYFTTDVKQPKILDEVSS